MSSKKSKATALKESSPSPLVEKGGSRVSERRDEDWKKKVKSLNTPQKIQDFLDDLPFNFYDEELTYNSPTKVLEMKKANCFEGACLAAALISQNGLGRPILMDLKIQKKFLKQDADHTLALFKINGFWGAISKTNHAVLRYRDPIYKTPRELALSYFHEYFIGNGYKVLESFSAPFDISKKFGDSWIAGEKELDEVAEALDRSRHEKFYPLIQKKYLRKATEIERMYSKNICEKH